MRSIANRTAIISLTLGLAYLNVPTSTDGNGAESPYTRASNVSR